MDRIQHKVVQVIGGKRYGTENATLLASSYGTGTGNHLYKSQKGNYFVAHSTIWEGRNDSIEPLSKEEAKARYELMNPDVSYEDAFGEKPEEA